MRIPKPILERRRSIRIEEALPFKIGAVGFELEATSLNISSSGAMCLLNRDIPLMTKLSLAITLTPPEPDPKRILKIKGVVVRKEKDPLTEKFHVAIFFSGMSNADRRFFKRFVTSRLP